MECALIILVLVCLYLIFWRPKTLYRVTEGHDRYFTYHVEKKVLFFWYSLRKTHSIEIATRTYERHIIGKRVSVIKQNW